MRFRLEQHVAGDVEAVQAALVDPAFLAHLGRLPELGSPRLLDQDVDGDVVRQRVRYRFVGELAPAVSAVVDPERLIWVEESVIDRRARRGEHRILPDHYAERLRCSYTTRLEPDGDVTRRTAEGDLVVRFPLVGGRVERAIVSGLTDHAEREGDALSEWVARRG